MIFALKSIDSLLIFTCSGYMAPEYAMAGQFSVKSDVFSFGVIVLEIISGKRSSGFYFTEHAETLLAYVCNNTVNLSSLFLHKFFVFFSLFQISDFLWMLKSTGMAFME